MVPDGGNRIVKRVPRNAPAMFNLGHRCVDQLFHDGRVSVSDLFRNGFNTPAEEWLSRGLVTITAAQALFLVTAKAEMAGQPRKNEVAGAANDRIDYVWPILTERVRAVPDYREMFVAAFDDVNSPADFTVMHIANAIGAFIDGEWQSHDSPFDAYLAGDEAALTASQTRGLALFYGEAGCAECHSGLLLTDNGFHALTIPHFGPGRTRRFDPYARDVGRMADSDALEDTYHFRILSPRNVTLTAPYEHNAVFATLEGIVRHHLDSAISFAEWSPDEVNLPNPTWLPYACEADVYGAVSQMMLQEASGAPVFLVDLVDMDETDDTGVVWHCSQAPISMQASKPWRKRPFTPVGRCCCSMSFHCGLLV